MTTATAPAPAPLLHRRPRIGEMRRRHVPQVARLEALVHTQPWSAGLFEAELGHADRRYLTAWGDGVVRRDLLGYGGVLLQLDEAHVTNVVTHPAVRRRGVAAAIVLALLDHAVARGARAATLEVRTGNTAAQRLYAGFGFAPVGVRPGYYAATPDAPAEDAIIMWAYDLDGPECAGRLADVRGRLTDQGRAA